ncbi:MAG: hypothetical protein HWE34_10090 [Methylocystaceae bacterium]|nr:hypothetical protein [Methylocystaceae bacterium]
MKQIKFAFLLVLLGGCSTITPPQTSTPPQASKDCATLLSTLDESLITLDGSIMGYATGPVKKDWPNQTRYMKNLVVNLKNASVCLHQDPDGIIPKTVTWLNKTSIYNKNDPSKNGAWYNIVFSQQVSICQGRRGSFAGTICADQTERKTPFTTGKKTWGFVNLQSNVNPAVAKSNQQIKENTSNLYNIDIFQIYNYLATVNGVEEAQDVYRNNYNQSEKITMKSGFTAESATMKQPLSFDLISGTSENQ